MPISDYLRKLRASIGHDLVLMPGVAAVIRNDEGHILLERRSDNGAWGLPAGAVDPGEEPAQAMVREVFEETGLKVVPIRILGVFGGLNRRFRYPNADVVEYTVIVFECKAVGGTLEMRDGESLELRYVPVEELPELEYPHSVFLHRPSLGNETTDSSFVWNDQWLERLGDES